MSLSGSEEKTSPVIYFIIITLPFLLFYWMIPFVASQTIGNDYQTSSIEYQMELLFSIKNGSFPLYVPGFAVGHSTSALTLGQVFHPLPHIASILPGYWDGQALQWNTFLRMLSLGFTHLFLFVFLRKLRINILLSFLLSCITVYNLRMLDLFRYGAALEAYTGHLLLCIAIGFHFINPSKVLGPLSIIGATYLLVCSGHPQMMYYGLLGSGLFLLIAPFYISTILPEKHNDMNYTVMFWIKTISYISLGILLSLAYILPFYFEFIAANAQRIGQSYAWADSYGDTFIGTLNSFFLPFRSDVHGVFGGTSLIIIAIILPVVRCFRVKIPYPVWIAWGVMLLTFLHMQGGRTPIHQWVWEYLPFASSFRIAGRISMIMPVFIMMILCWLVKANSIPFRLRGASVMLSPLSLLAVGGIFIMAVYYVSIIVSIQSQSSIMLDFSHFIPVTIRKIPRIVEILVILSGISALMTLVFYEARQRTNKTLGILICLFTLVQIGSVLKYGTWIADRHDKPTFEQMQKQKKLKLDYPFNPGSGMYSSTVLSQLEHSFIEPFLGKIYTQAIPVDSLEKSYEMMAQKRLPQQIFVEDFKMEYNSGISSHDTQDEQFIVELIYSSFNRLQFRVVSPASAFFGLSYPYTGHWNAWLNDHKVSIYRANGLAHAIQIPKGESLIEFRYWSSPTFWGLLLSCITFIIISLYFCTISLTGSARVLAAVLVLATGIGGFTLWHHSLYTGDNLGTQYFWKYKNTPLMPNLAYGKKTWVSQPLTGGYFHIHSSRAIDGDRAPKSGFFMGPHDNPTWTTDLHRSEQIKSIVIYRGIYSQPADICALNLALSQDGEQWHTAVSVKSIANPEDPMQINFETPETARYIRIRATDYCSLSIDEVEVYGP